MGEHPVADEEEGLDRAATQDDEAGGAGSWTEDAGIWSLAGPRLIAVGQGSRAMAALRASALVESLQKVGTPDVPAIVKQLSGYRRWADPQLVRAVQSSRMTREHLHASLALLPVDASQVDYLFNRLLNATPSELPVLRDALKPHRPP